MTPWQLFKPPKIDWKQKKPSKIIPSVFQIPLNTVENYCNFSTPVEDNNELILIKNSSGDVEMIGKWKKNYKKSRYFGQEYLSGPTLKRNSLQWLLNILIFNLLYGSNNLATVGAVWG